MSQSVGPIKLSQCEASDFGQLSSASAKLLTLQNRMEILDKVERDLDLPR